MVNFSVEQLRVGQIDTNCYFLIDEDTQRIAIIDPGAEEERIAALIDKKGWHPAVIINTHGHWDHVGGNRYLKERYQVPVMIHEADAPYLTDGGLNLAAWMGQDGDAGVADVILKEGDEIHVGGLRLEVLHTPGHTPGGICLYMPVGDLVFCGDTLFELSTGRSDLPGGDWDQLAASIKDKLYNLPDQTVAYPGHGEKTQIGREKKDNPYVKG